MKWLKAPSSKFSYWNRERKLRFVLDYIDKHNINSCLIVGASPNATGTSFVNLIERGLLKKSRVVTASGLEQSGGDWNSWVTADGRELPFQNRSFDLVFSNAVIEHVGLLEDQVKFAREHDRVGKFWIFTTPNRHFPIESHTQIVFRHMRQNWKHPLISRLLSKKDLMQILPSSGAIQGRFFSPTFICYKENSSNESLGNLTQ